MQREGLKGPLRVAGHVILVVAGWFIFFYWWYLVAIRGWAETQVALLIFVTLFAAPAVTLGWVAHNLGIFKRKGPRKGVPPVAMDYAHDWNQRRVVADWATLGEAGVIALTVVDDRKLYAPETVAVEPAQPEPALQAE
jgi:hypothetical protein